jgi:hypothetical protein
MRKCCALVILTLALAFAAYGDDGHVGCPGATVPPPPESPTIATGEMLQPIVEAIATAVLSLP